MSWSTQDFFLIGMLIFLGLIVLMGWFCHWHDRHYLWVSPKRLHQFKTGAWMADCKGRR